MLTMLTSTKVQMLTPAQRVAAACRLFSTKFTTDTVPNSPLIHRKNGSRSWLQWEGDQAQTEAFYKSTNAD
jgi:hypothetical protein